MGRRGRLAGAGRAVEADKTGPAGDLVHPIPAAARAGSPAARARDRRGVAARQILAAPGHRHGAPGVSQRSGARSPARQRVARGRAHRRAGKWADGIPTRDARSGRRLPGPGRRRRTTHRGPFASSRKRRRCGAIWTDRGPDRSGVRPSGRNSYGRWPVDPRTPSGDRRRRGPAPVRVVTAGGGRAPVFATTSTSSSGTRRSSRSTTVSTASSRGGRGIWRPPGLCTSAPTKTDSCAGWPI